MGIDIGTQGPVPALKTHVNNHRVRVVALSLASVMIYIGIKMHNKREFQTHREGGKGKIGAELDEILQTQAKKCLQPPQPGRNKAQVLP